MKAEGRTFVVSGGASGLGLATSLKLYNSGAYISILDVKENEDLLKQLGKRAKFFQTNILENDDVERAVEGTVSWTKETGAPLGGVINCAGTGMPAKIIDARGNVHSLDLWNLVIAVNLTGSFNLTRLVCNHLTKVAPEGTDGERGIVIFVSSSAAFEGQAGQVAYAASKGALNSMVLPLARDLGYYGIRVNSIAPGAFETPMTALMSKKGRESVIRDLLYPHRLGLPDEFATLVQSIIDNAYFNGEVVRLSGGARLPGKL